MIIRQRTINPPRWAGQPMEELVDGWPVILGFEPEAEEAEAVLIDVSHLNKGLLQGPGLEPFSGLKPAEVTAAGPGLICALNPAEAVVFGLARGGLDFSGSGFTDLSEAWVLLALLGPEAVEVLRRLSPVDLERPYQKEPFLAACPLAQVPVQVVALKTPEPAWLVAGERSFGQALYDAILETGRHVGLRPAGVKRFEAWLEASPWGG